jgi:hypothetical protein
MWYRDGGLRQNCVLQVAQLRLKSFPSRLISVASIS